MALTESKLQDAMLKKNGVDVTAKADRMMFGSPQLGYANGGYMHRTKRYDQTGAPTGACMADGGMVGAIKNMQGQRDAAIEAAVNGPAKPAAPAVPAKPAAAPAEPDDSAIGIHIPKPAPEAPAPKKGLLARILGLADGGEVDPRYTSARAPGVLSPAAQGVQSEEQQGAANRANMAASLAPVEAALGRPVDPAAFKAGGTVHGPGGPTDDKIPAMLSNGEYVLPADTVRAIGKEKLDAIKDATHTPVRSRFGNMANGGVPGYDVEEIPDIQAQPASMTPEQIRLANNPALNDPNVQARIAQANKIGSVPPAQAAAPAAEAAEAAPKSVFGRALGAARGLLAPAAKSVGVVRGAAGLLASAPVAGAALALRSGDVGAQSDVLSNPTTGAVTNQYQGNAMTPQFAALSEPDRYKMLAERNDPGTSPARVAQLDSFMKGGAANVDPSAKYSAGAFSDARYDAAHGASDSVPAANPNGITPVQASFFGQAGVPESALSSAPAPDHRAAVEAGAAPGATVNLGDYGGNGQTIFGKADSTGRINSFTGAGGGTNKATGYVPQGVDFGITPAQLAAYKEAQNAQPAAAAPQAPQYQHDARADQINTQIVGLSQKLASMSPGDLGRGAIRHQIATLQSVAQGLQTSDAQRNTFNATQFGQTSALANEAANRQIRERELTLGHAAQLGQIDASRYGSELTFKEAKARLDNDKDQKLFERNRSNWEDGNKMLQSAAISEAGDTPEGKQLTAEMQSLAEQRKFSTPEGDKYFWQLSGQQRAPLIGVLRNEVEANRRAKAGGLPTSNQGAIQFGSPSVAGVINSFRKAPIDSIRYGVNQVKDGNFLTAAPNKQPSLEAYEAQKRAANFGTPQR